MPARRHPACLLAASVVAAVIVAVPPASAAPDQAGPVATTTPAAPTTPAPVTTTTAPPAPAPSGRQTPVLSLRRVPELVALIAGISKLDTALDATLSDPTLGAVSASTCLTVQAGPMPLYVHNPALPVIPASNLKLLTATAALDLLPSGQRFDTTVKADTAPANGTVTGNLYLVGGGDPLLRTPDYAATLYPPEPIYDNLATLADRVKAAGVTAVTGSVVGDESRYDTQRVVPTWPPHYLAVGEVGPLSALSVNDGFAAFKPTLMPAPQPAQQAAATFTTLLQGRGISVAGPAAAGTAPPPAVRVADLMSAPLSDELGEILRSSDNNGAELITKELGRHANAATPTTRAGVTAIQTDIGADGLPVSGLHMVDGSGLDRGNRVTCQLILAALMRSGPDGALARDLPVAAKSGTLINRMAGTPAAGRLRAKTGTLDGVAALSGFVTPPPGSSSPNGASSPGAVTFSLITNAAPSVAAGERLGNLVGAGLAQFPQVPPIAALAP